jgi:hypothetical protein
VSLLNIVIISLFTYSVFLLSIIDLYSPPNIIRMIKLKRMRLAGHVACMETKSTYRVLVGKPQQSRSPLSPRYRPRHSSGG